MTQHTLQQELATYYQQLPTLLAKAGKFVLIQSDTIAGIFDSYEDALTIGYEKFGLDGFLVKRISATEQVAFFSRDFKGIPCPA